MKHTIASCSHTARLVVGYHVVLLFFSIILYFIENIDFSEFLTLSAIFICTTVVGGTLLNRYIDNISSTKGRLVPIDRITVNMYMLVILGLFLFSSEVMRKKIDFAYVLFVIVIVEVVFSFYLGKIIAKSFGR